jgi:DNA mismatch repair protein MutS2
MIEHSLRVLEYYRLLDFLSRYAASPLGRSDCLSRKPLRELESIKGEQRLVSEMKELLLVKGSVSLSSLTDLRPLLRKADKKSSCLEPKELLAIHNLLRVSHRVKDWVRESSELCPSLEEITDTIPEVPSLAHEIEGSITETGEISDSASPQLAHVRSQRVALRRAVEKKLGRILQNPEFSDDNIMSVRDGRYVVSVRTGKRNSVKGIIHGYSGTHSTCFIEPLAVVEENNHLVELKDREREEERRVLRRLTALVADFSADLLSCLEIMSRIDGLFARAEFSKVINGITPVLDTERVVCLSGALNPILLSLYLDSSKKDAKEDTHRAVPIDVRMDARKNTLIISGPNRGGKTVALKTIGLLALMTQAGMHIPAQEGTKLCVFDHILAEIGDEQDISSGLSTFSARLENLREIVDHATESSLVILDELGVGTDPNEGTALAMAIMDYLSDKGSMSAISTHYQRLKTYGLINKKAQNASVEFDNDSGRPTFRLRTGMPGVSHAIDIARGAGLKQEIIERTSTYLEKDRTKADSVMEDLLRIMEEVKREKRSVTVARQEYEQSKSSLDEERESLRHGLNEILSQKEREADKLIGEARGEFREVIDHLKETGSRGQSKATQRYTQVKRDLIDAIERIKWVKSSAHPNQLTIGQPVFHARSKKKGWIVGLDKGSSKAHIMAGNMRLTVDSSELIPESELPHQQGKDRPGPRQWSVSSPSLDKRELNLVGHTVAEAISLVDQMIDKALVHGYSRLTIVHGIGSGTLKRAIREHLRQSAYVSDFIPGGKNGENDGITIVEL